MIKKIKLFFLQLAIFILRGIYAILKLLPTQKKITFISRQSNTPSIDFFMVEDAIHKEYKDYKTVLNLLMLFIC